MIVVDVNLLVYLLIEGEHTVGASNVFERDSDWTAPRLWRSEFRNVLVRFVRQGQLTLPQAKELMMDASTIVDDGILDPDSKVILQLALDSGCTAYDAEYVGLAQALGVPLITADKQVLRAFPTMAQSPQSYLS